MHDSLRTERRIAMRFGTCDWKMDRLENACLLWSRLIITTFVMENISLQQLEKPYNSSCMLYSDEISTQLDLQGFSRCWSAIFSISDTTINFGSMPLTPL